MYNHCSCLFFCSSVMLQWKNMLSKNQQNRVKHVEYQVTAPLAYQHVNSFLITTGVPVNYTQWTITDSMGQLELPPLFSCTSWRRAYVIKLLYNFHVLLKHGITRIFFFSKVYYKRSQTFKTFKSTLCTQNSLGIRTSVSVLVFFPISFHCPRVPRCY